jgi:hypothetical protein
VNLEIASVVNHLPSTDDNNAPFAGTVHGRHLPRPEISPTHEHTLKVKQTALQMHDAEQRNIMWDAEELGDEDAEGEDDEEYLSSVNKICCNNVLKTTRMGRASSAAFMQPIGIRKVQGGIAAILPSNEEITAGVSEVVPRHVGDLVGLVFFLH